MQQEAIIKLSDITVSYGKHIVFDEASVDIFEGDLFGVVGLSGSGKTTLLNTIIGFIDPIDGDVLFRLKSMRKGQETLEYVPIRKNLLKVRKLFGFAAQEPSFYMKLTVRENLDYFASMYGLKKHVRANNIKTVLELVGLERYQNLLSDQLSGGMKKRLDIACSLIQNPEVLILDEPTSDLDPLLRMEMWDLIKKINKKGTTIIISSHFLNEMEKLCSRIGIINNKKIDLVGTPDYIRGLYTKDEEIHVETVPGNYEEIIRQIHKTEGLKISNILNKGHELVIYTQEPVEVLYTLLHLIKKHKEHLVDISVTRPSLSEVFESLLKGKVHE
jgi:ABC-2 type transport system ATP-binding protein